MRRVSHVRLSDAFNWSSKLWRRSFQSLSITYSVLGLNEGVVDGDNVDLIVLNTVASLVSGGPAASYLSRRCTYALRKTIRPMRPKPLIPTCSLISCCSSVAIWTALVVYLDTHFCFCGVAVSSTKLKRLHKIVLAGGCCARTDVIDVWKVVCDVVVERKRGCAVGTGENLVSGQAGGMSDCSRDRSWRGKQSSDVCCHASPDCYHSSARGRLQERDTYKNEEMNGRG